MIKLGIMLDNIGPNQLAHYFINSANSALYNNSQLLDVVAFTEQTIHPVAVPNFSTMNISEAFDYHGALVATSLRTAYKMLKCPGTRKKYFYVWDLEWTKPTNVNFASLNSIYNNPSIELIARSQPHADILELCWKKPVGIVEDARIEQFYSLLEKTYVT